MCSKASESQKLSDSVSALLSNWVEVIPHYQETRNNAAHRLCKIKFICRLRTLPGAPTRVYFGERGRGVPQHRQRCGGGSQALAQGRDPARTLAVWHSTFCAGILGEKALRAFDRRPGTRTLCLRNDTRNDLVINRQLPVYVASVSSHGPSNKLPDIQCT